MISKQHTIGLLIIASIVFAGCQAATPSVSPAPIKPVVSTSPNATIDPSSKSEVFSDPDVKEINKQLDSLDGDRDFPSFNDQDL